MRHLFIILFGVFVWASVSSCGDASGKNAADKHLKAQELYEKYKAMITEGNGCVPCADCASLALAISYDTKDEISVSKKKLIEYYKKNGTIPCPELVPELKEIVAQIPK
ncbi:MAG: hypothetical protein L3J74_03425 [Bacteroidales bacterium]|nr:hypothetical protein [Bacteroidales bacterium]